MMMMPPTMTSIMDDEVNRAMASQFGLNLHQVEFLRQEFRKYGRNPLPCSLEILALENGFDEQLVKNLFTLHLQHLRRSDGLPAGQKSVYD